MSAKKKTEIHLVSHSHWDREWYSTFEEFRIRLVKLVDRVLEILDSGAGFKYFTLDGQTIPLEDYLEIRPENREKITKYIKSGRLVAGPWYVQPDEFLVSGESLIRNLMIGREIGRQFGPVMEIGYQPDAFGHVSQMPQIYRGFGMESAMLMRGTGREAEKIGLEFNWQAPDGSEVLCIHLFGTGKGSGYSNVGGLGYESMWDQKDFSMERALEAVRKLTATLEPLLRTPYLLASNGGDHLMPQANMPEIIEYCNARLEEAKIVHSTHAAYVAKVKGAKVKGAKLATYKGEMRKSRYMPLLVNVLSARMYIKQKNFSAQNLLEKYAEPLATFAYMEGKDYPAAFLRQAWKYLVQTHPHDTICGCSIDAVHDDAMRRADWVERIGQNFVSESMGHLAWTAGGRKHEGERVTVYNTLPWKREETVDVGGEEYCVEIPACGYRTFERGELKARRVVERSKGERVLENEAVKVEVAANGTLTITDKGSGLSYSNLNYFEDTEDCGDLYNFSTAEKSLTLNTLKERPKVRKKAGKIEIEYKLKLPVGVVDLYMKRAAKMVACTLRTTVSLDGHSPVVRIVTEFDNRVKDHRLRAGFDAGIVTDHSMAEGQFDVVKREVGYDPEDWVMEYCRGIHPQQGFVAISDGRRGLMIANKGLPEYEHDREKGLYVTLLRGVEWINALGWVNRRTRHWQSGDSPKNGKPFGHAPGGQCLGAQRFEYAVIPFAGSWEGRLREAYNYLAPVMVQAASDMPAGEKSFMTLEPEGLILSAVTKAERGSGVIVRVFNPTSKKKVARLRMDREIKTARLVRLDEAPLEKLAAKGKEVRFEVRAGEIRTVELGVFK